MRIFLDIGAHVGETLDVVSKSHWNFDRIVCFEPSSECWPILQRKASGRVELCKYGLLDREETRDLYNAGSIGASIAIDKNAVAVVEKCDFKDAAFWFNDNISIDDEVFVKINVEGAETSIIQRLSESNEISKIDHLLIHLDSRKVPSMKGRDLETLRILDETGTPYLLAEDIIFGGPGRGTENWLRWCNSSSRHRDLRFKTLRRLEHRFRVLLYPLKVVAVRRLGRIGVLGCCPT